MTGVLLMFGLWLAVGAVHGSQREGDRESAGLRSPGPGGRVLAVESFLADLVRNVAGGRFAVEPLIPPGVDPHTFEPTPKDARLVAESVLVVANGAGLETFLDDLLESAGGSPRIVVASEGIEGRKHGAGGDDAEQADGARAEDDEHSHGEVDPHFWLDPMLTIRYVENIRRGLSRIDPEGAGVYERNARDYAEKLRELDEWIRGQVARVPERDRLLVTNHESFGYFAARYGFEVIGTIVPSVSSGSAPSARQLALLSREIRQRGVKAVFLEAGSNTKLGRQIARDAQVRIVEGLYTHSLTDPGGEAPTYIDMMRANTKMIVEALR